MPINSFAVAVLNKRLKNQVTPQTLNAAKFLMWLKKWGRIKYGVGGSDGIDFWVQYRESGTGARAIGDFTELEAETIDDFIKLTVPWSRYGRALANSKFQEKRAKNTDKEDKNFDWLVNQFNAFSRQFQGVFATDAYGDGTRVAARNDVGDPMLGLQAWLSGTSTILGVDRNVTAGSYFRAKVGTTIADFFGDDNLNDVNNGLEGLNTLWNQCCVGQFAGGNTPESIPDAFDMPDLTLCDQTNYERYQNSLNARSMVMSDGADMSYKTLTLNQKPIDWDHYHFSGFSMIAKKYWTLNSAEPDGKLLDVYAEDNTGMIKKVNIAGQNILMCEKPASNGRLSVTA